MDETPQEFRKRMLSVGFVSKRGDTTVGEYVNSKGHRTKMTTDHHGTHDVTVTTTDGRQDVTVHAPRVLLSEQRRDG